MKKILLFTCFFLYSLVASAATQQDHAIIKATAAAFVKQQTANIPGTVSYSVSDIDQRVVLRACGKIEAFLPPGSQMIGRVSIGVRCNEANGWSIFVPVQIQISRNLIISARSLTQGQVVHEEDIARQTTETTQNIGIMDEKQVLGKVLRYSIAAGYVIREDMLRAPYLVKQGQTVQLSVQGNGFSLSSSGVALNNASEGENVQIRTVTGRVISGIASSEGTVTVNP